MDPGTALNVVSLGIQVLQGLVSYYDSWKSYEQDIFHTHSVLLRNLRTLKTLEEALTQPRLATRSSKSIAPASNAQLQTAEVILACRQGFLDLQKKLDKIGQTPQPQTALSKIRSHGRRALYPFRETTLLKLRAIMDDLKDDLTLALQVLDVEVLESQTNTLEYIQDGVSHLLGDSLEYQKHMERETMKEWLQAPDPWSNHNAARGKRQPRTGLWFIDSPRYRDWIAREASFIWLMGFAGCGKTILFSTVAQNILERCRSGSNYGVAVFYFDFTDPQKQDQSMLLRSVLWQLQDQVGTFKTEKQKIQPGPHAQVPFDLDLDTDKQGGHLGSRARVPTVSDLLSLLKDVVERFGGAFLLIDALDECKRGSDRDNLLETLSVIRNWNIKHLHVLVTSRDEKEIRDHLLPTSKEEVSIEHQNADINLYVQETLKTNKRLQKWLPYHEEIRTALTKGAHGMFRWVDCQLDAINKCRTPAQLGAALRSLPATLAETYDGIISSIDKQDLGNAERILCWLCYSIRSVTLAEVAETLKLDVEESQYKDEWRLMDPTDVLAICPNLITKVLVDKDDPKYSRIKKNTVILRLAHSSVKDYLLTRYQHPKRNHILDLHPVRAHSMIAKSCLTYLLHFERPGSLSEKTLDEFPLASYATAYWVHHQLLAGEDERLVSLAKEKLLSRYGVRIMEASLLQEEDTELSRTRADTWRIKMTENKRPPPTILASLMGLSFVVRDLLREAPKSVNASWPAWELFPNPLQAACWNGSEDAVRALIATSAAIKFRDGVYGSALGIASGHRGSVSMVRLLLAHGADLSIEAQGEIEGWTPLCLAAAWGTDAIVELLLENGAFHYQGGKDGNPTALHVAALYSKFSVVKALLSVGADPWRNCAGDRLTIWFDRLQKGDYLRQETNISAFKIITHNIHLDMCAEIEGFGRLLLSSQNSYENLDGPEWLSVRQTDNGIYAAIVDLFVTREFEYCQALPLFGCAVLEGCAWQGKWDLVLEVLQKEEFNLSNLALNRTMYAASLKGNMNIVQRMIEAGADASFKDGTTNGTYTVLHTAIYSRHEDIAQFLIMNGADIEAKSGPLAESPLDIAAMKGLQSCVRMLLECGARPDCGREIGWTSLLHASNQGHTEICRLLVDSGARLDAHTSTGWTSLMLASGRGYMETCQYLIEAGANLDSCHSGGWTSLMVVTSEGHAAISRLLIEAGARLDCCNSKGWTSLMVASRLNETEICQILIESGAQVNCCNFYGSTPLLLAAQRSSLDTVRLLLDHGAEYRGIMENGGDDALACAAMGGLVGTVKHFVNLGLDHLQKNTKGETRLEAVQALMVMAETGPDEVQDKYGPTLESLKEVEEFLLGLSAAKAPDPNPGPDPDPNPPPP